MFCIVFLEENNFTTKGAPPTHSSYTRNHHNSLKKPVGCAACNETGYAGRTGLHELLDGSDEIKRMIMKKELVENLREQAINDGMTTLKQDGIYKIFKGDCDLKQVLAVCIV